MRNLIALLASLAVGACAELPVEHVPGTEGVPTDQLAVVYVITSEVQLLEIDGKRDLPNTASYFYIHPGMHRFVFALHFEPVCVDVGPCLDSVKTSPVTRDACVYVEPGMEYIFLAAGGSISEVLRRPRGEWKLYVYKRVIGEGSRDKEIDSACPQ